MKGIPPHILWPGFVIGLLLVGVASTMSVFYFARSDGGPSVVADYYEQAVAWDSLAAARSDFGRRGWTARAAIQPLEEGNARFYVDIVDSSGVPVSGLQAALALFRPSEDAPVARYEGETDSTGRIAFESGPLARGLWDIELTGTAQGRSFGVRQRVGLE